VGEFTAKTSGGFDIAVLTQKANGEALVHKASSLSEIAQKERLFLISNNETPVISPIKHNKAKDKNDRPKRTINRKKIIFDDSFTYKGKTYRVNPAKSGLYVEILESIISQFQIAQSKWGRVFVLRFDLHMDIHRRDNSIITGFIKRAFQKLKRAYSFKDIGYAWAREQERSKKQHYHFVLFLDGDLIRHSSKINQIIKQAWEREGSNCYMPVIPRPFHFADNEEAVQDMLKRISYLAKPRGKGYRDKQVKDFNCSRMKALAKDHKSITVNKEKND